MWSRKTAAGDTGLSQAMEGMPRCTGRAYRATVSSFIIGINGEESTVPPKDLLDHMSDRRVVIEQLDRIHTGLT